MKVEIEVRDRTFFYRLRPDPDDPEKARREFKDSPDPFRLVHREYRMALPETFKTIHPDAHAAAVWLALKPVVGSRLDLPFAVSEAFAGWMLRTRRVRLSRVSRKQSPRERPDRVVPALLYSGGMDSTVASLLMPPATHHLFLDRIPHQGPKEALIDLVRQRAACEAVRRAGRPVHVTADDHEHLFSPYPMWHSNMALLSCLTMADSLGLSTIDGGEVLDAVYFGGYLGRTKVRRWRMRPPPADGRGLPERDGARGGDAAPRTDHWDLLSAVGLSFASCVAGLSEVATAAMVARSRMRGKSFSCYYPSAESFCMRCDKCFKKLLLRHIAEGTEVPAALFGHFLGIPYLAAIFSRPYFDWHHVWYYVFQKMRCRHWFARELHRQAREGPDLSCLEKWYPKALRELEPAYAEVVVEAISRRVPAMTSAEVALLEGVDVPPLHAPRMKEARKGPAAPAPTPGPQAFPPPLAEIQAVFDLLRAGLPSEAKSRWKAHRLDEVVLDPSDPVVWLRISRVGAKGDPALVRVFWIGGFEDRFAARLGPVGVSLGAECVIDDAFLAEIRLSLAAVLGPAAEKLAGRPRL
ncbi:MAG: hypothetical protein HY748_10920 [Elusimicrobia bacterium]|nr:hypothetical protein [Elusimicrobiota bacterium]